MNREPSAIISALGAFLSAIAKVAVLLNLVDWDADQLAGISLVIDTLLILLGAIFIRSQVTPTKAPVLAEGTVVTTTSPDTGAVSGTTTI